MLPTLKHARPVFDCIMFSISEVFGVHSRIAGSKAIHVFPLNPILVSLSLQAKRVAQVLHLIETERLKSNP